jgi:hypothetical protein
MHSAKRCSGGRLLANAFGVSAAEGDRFAVPAAEEIACRKCFYFYQMNAVALAIPNSF